MSAVLDARENWRRQGHGPMEGTRPTGEAQQYARKRAPPGSRSNGGDTTHGAGYAHAGLGIQSKPRGHGMGLQSMTTLRLATAWASKA